MSKSTTSTSTPKIMKITPMTLKDVNQLWETRERYFNRCHKIIKVQLPNPPSLHIIPCVIVPCRTVLRIRIKKNGQERTRRGRRWRDEPSTATTTSMNKKVKS